MGTDEGMLKTPVCVYIGIGSNLDNPYWQVVAACTALAALPESRVLAQSPWYRNRALGPGEQANYLNGVVALETRLAPLVLLAALQAIEQQQGRTRTQRWAARTLDLDILLYGHYAITEPTLHVPHPRLYERYFVLYPLSMLAPQLVLPNGRSITACLADCPQHVLLEYSDRRHF